MSDNDARKLYDRATGAESRVVHVRVMGRSRDIALDSINIGAQASDDAVREAVARFLEIEPIQLNGTVVERHENGNMTVRPEAVFG